MPRFSIKARLITFFKNRRTVDIWNNEILLKKVCVYTGINLIQAAKKEIFMNYDADKKRAPEIKIIFILWGLASSFGRKLCWRSPRGIGNIRPEKAQS